jgi:FHA domain
MDDLITCPKCNHGGISLAATICPECGCRLPPRAPLPEQKQHTFEAAAVTGTDPFAEPIIVVELHVSSTLGSRSVSLDSGARLVIGTEAGPLTDLCTDNISRYHAEITVAADCVGIRDVGLDSRGSTNGTFVNGFRIGANVVTPLNDGAVVLCGADPALTIKVSVTDS